MRKVLIYFQESELAPVGGPKGYLYNLKKELDNMPHRNDIEISFVKGGREKINKCKNKIEAMKPGKVKNILLCIKSIIKHFLLLYGKKHISLVNLDAFDYVHFHSTLDMYNVRDSLREYKGKIILSSHSPTLLSKEILNSVPRFEKKMCGFICKNLIRMDEYAFEKADYIFFPCKESEEPYFHAWDKYKIIKEKKKLSYRYLLTGIQECTVKKSRGEIREKYSIPENAFVICFVGRHNFIKGYDLFIKICEQLLRDNKVYVLVAGTESSLLGLEDKRWIRVGWTKDPYSIINASDVFVLPNRETYFDLVLLEVLSIGKIIVASNTGGNKFFGKEKYRGIFLYNTIEEAVNQITKIKGLDNAKRQELEQNNKRIFMGEFTARTFAQNYISQILKL